MVALCVRKRKEEVFRNSSVDEWFDGASAGELVINSAKLNLRYLRRLPPRALGTFSPQGVKESQGNAPGLRYAHPPSPILPQPQRHYSPPFSFFHTTQHPPPPIILLSTSLTQFLSPSPSASANGLFITAATTYFRLP